MAWGFSPAFNYNMGGSLKMNMEDWKKLDSPIGIGYAAKAHKGVYMQIDWKDFNRWVAKTLHAGNEGSRRGLFNIGRRLFDKIKDRNPVLTGLSKRAWELRIKGLADPNRPSIVIANQVFYVVYLELGSSKKAPHGMVRISMKEMMGLPAAEIALQLKKEYANFTTARMKIPRSVYRTLKLPYGGNL
jgi:hypothetical protein